MSVPPLERGTPNTDLPLLRAGGFEVRVRQFGQHAGESGGAVVITPPGCSRPNSPGVRSFCILSVRDSLRETIEIPKQSATGVGLEELHREFMLDIRLLNDR